MYGSFYLFIYFVIIFFLCKRSSKWAVALYVFRELRLAAYRDRIAAACTVCTSCYAKFQVRTACTSLLITGDQGDKMKNNCVNFWISIVIPFLLFEIVYDPQHYTTTCTRTHTHMHTHAHVHTHMYAHTRTHTTHAHTYTHTHTIVSTPIEDYIWLTKRGCAYDTQTHTTCKLPNRGLVIWVTKRGRAC